MRTSFFFVSTLLFASEKAQASQSVHRHRELKWFIRGLLVQNSKQFFKAKVFGEKEPNFLFSFFILTN